MAYTFRLRRGPATEWFTDNPILQEGEPGVEVDTGRMKVGNGVSYWNDLPYIGGGVSTETDLDIHIESPTPHPVYDDGPSLTLLYENAKV